MCILNHIVDLGFDAGVEKFKERIDENKLKSILREYIERQRKYNAVSSLAEEIDFQGLAEYIEQHMMDDVATRVFDPDRGKRAQARTDIISAAVQYSGAETRAAKRRVTKCINQCLDIVFDFYRKKFKQKEYLLAAEVVDAITGEIQVSAASIEQAVNRGTEEIRNTVMSHHEDTLATITAKMDQVALFSYCKVADLAKNRQFSTIGDGIQRVLDVASLDHPFYPYFGVDYSHGKMVSRALTEEAKKKYPVKFALTGAIRFGDEYYADPDGNPLDYSYRYQLPFVMEISSAKKYLGEYLDPIQDEAKQLEGQSMIGIPPEFPSAFACAIKVGGQTLFDYVLMRIQEIMDDGTIVVGNKEQASPLYFEVKIDPQKAKMPDFKICIQNGNHREILEFMRFFKALSEAKDIHIYVLEAEKDMFAGYVSSVDYNNISSFSSVDEEIEFLERICEIEEYFAISFGKMNEVYKEDYDILLYISNLIRNGESTGTWSEVTLTGTLDATLRKGLESMESDAVAFSYVGTAHVELFDAEFEFRYMRTYKCARIADFERIKQKMQVLDNGDSIRLVLRAGENKAVIDTLNIPEQ